MENLPLTGHLTESELLAAVEANTAVTPPTFDDRLAELQARIDQPALTTEIATEDAIMVYQAAAALIAEVKEVQNAAKAQLIEIIEETGETKFVTNAGTASITKPGVTVKWDRKALDALCLSNGDLAEMLYPHRTETERPGTLRITAKK